MNTAKSTTTATRTRRTGHGRDTETAPVASDNGGEPVLSALPEIVAEGNNAGTDITAATVLPAADAIAQVAEKVAEQQPLFEPEAFNFSDVYMNLEVMAVEADRLHRIWEGDAKTAKESKQAAEEASRRHVTASLEYRRRRLLKRDSAESSAPQIATIDLWEAVRATGQILLEGTIEAWSDEERAAVAGWTTMPERDRPSVLGTPHIAADTVTSEAAPGDTFVCCATCGARLSSTPTAGEDSIKMYPPGAKVGTDCPGPDVAHHYPERKKRRRAPVEAASPIDEQEAAIPAAFGGAAAQE